LEWLIFILQIRRRMRILNVSSNGAKGPGSKSEAVQPMPNPAFCRARRARWPGVVYCLADASAGCKHTRFFNNVAYCIHPERDAIIARMKAQKDACPGGSNSSRQH